MAPSTSSSPPTSLSDQSGSRGSSSRSSHVLLEARSAARSAASASLLRMRAAWSWRHASMLPAAADHTRTCRSPDAGGCRIGDCVPRTSTVHCERETLMDGCVCVIAHADER